CNYGSYWEVSKRKEKGSVRQRKWSERKRKGLERKRKGQMQRDEVTEDKIRKNLEHEYMKDMLLQEEQNFDA
ncbi:hypothetical protein Tco_0932238, partial [Tanacetum coccineum]